MAVVICYGIQTYGLWREQNPPQSAVNLGNIELGPIFTPTLCPPFLYGSIVDNLPITLEPRVSSDGYWQKSFRDDYYNRIHIVPGVIALGNLLTAQTRTIEVWSAYGISQPLTSVTSSNSDGITLTQPIAAPTTFAPLESRNYTVNISTNGPPIISPVFTFTFANVATAATPNLSITGRRVVIWPFLPETGYTEKMEWKTDVIEAFNNEQRIAVREAPRQSFEHEFYLDSQQFSRAKAMTTQWGHRVYGLPVWDELTILETGLTSGATVINFDTTNADYRENDIIILWSSDTNASALEITTVTPTSVTLKLPLTSNWPRCFIAPLRFCRTLEGASFSRTSNEYATAKMEFLVTSNKDLGDDGSYPTYRTKPVMTDRSAVVGDLSERIARSIDIFDNGSGPIDVDITNNWVRFLQTMSFIKNDRASIWSLRKWIHARRGKQRSFWLPSWNKDINILEDCADTATSLTISAIGYPLYYSTKDILIQLRNGTRIFTRATSGSTNEQNNETLLLSAALGTGFTVADIDFACFMSHVRLDTDNVSFNHINFGQVATSIAVVEIPE